MCTLDSTNCIPICIDEYKPSRMQPQKIRYISEALRVAYNNGEAPRGQKDQSVRWYKYQAPIIIAGEETFSEQAILDRILPVFITIADSEKHESAFKALQELPLERLGRSLLARALQTSDEELITWKAQAEASTPAEITHRRRRNVVIAKIGLYLLGAVLGVNVDMSAVNAAMLLNHSENSMKGVVETILEEMSALSMYNLLGGKSEPRYPHCCIEIGSDVVKSGDYLYLHLTTCMDMWQKYRDTNSGTGDRLTREDFQRYIKTKPYYVDNNVSKKGEHGGNRKRLVLSLSKMAEAGIELSEEWTTGLAVRTEVPF
jgi:hypothetical protein